MAESKTLIVVALIGLAGTLGAAYITNMGKSGAAAGTSTTVGPAPPIAEAERLSQSQSKAYGEAASALDSISAQIAGSGAVVPDISGSWYSDDGYRFDFAQSGASYSFTQFNNGVKDGSGQGALDGRRFRHSFSDDDGTTGRCEGEVSSDGRTSAGTCKSDGGGDWSFVVKRR